ncbi:MAG: aminomethyl-transferring glycine dehydrogenase subunit GcvPA, partial [Bdellovibrionales bacterium]|nr:aminomethyl-transferring glycine dehydrogenase subunit GcvPA [Bdellovibrionales bacterium]
MMRYIPLTKSDQEAMLKVIGVESVEALFSTIPADIRKKSLSGLPFGKTEAELTHFFKNLSLKNEISGSNGWSSYLGCGAYEHFTPSVVDALSMRGEFATAYTPYQPEVSQGTLQAIFEFQSMIANLYGMDVANASMYDGASATAEAVLMAVRVKKKKTILVSLGVHPEYRKVIQSYVSDMDVVLKNIDLNDQGMTDVAKSDQDIAGILVAQPNYFGVIEDLKKISNFAKSVDAMFIVTNTEPIAFGLLKPPGKFDADIVAGEGQSFGNGLSFGGPYVGLFTTRKPLLRQMPGRLVGQTVDQDNRKGYVLTLATREQHIRREKATSNICTNHSLCALRSAIHMALLGRSGLKELAQQNYARAQTLKRMLLEIKGVSLKYEAPFFNEFTLNLPVSSSSFLAGMQEMKILAGVPVSTWDDSRKTEVIISVTETKTI